MGPAAEEVGVTSHSDGGDTSSAQYFHIVTRKNGIRIPAVGRGQKRGCRPKAGRQRAPARVCPPTLMVNERERRKTSKRFNVFLEVLKGERDFYIEEGPPQAPCRGRRRKDPGGAGPRLSVLSESLEEDTVDKTCVIHVKEDPLGMAACVGGPGGLPGEEVPLLPLGEEGAAALPPAPFSELDLQIGEPLFSSADVTDLKTFQISYPIDAGADPQREGDRPPRSGLLSETPSRPFEAPGSTLEGTGGRSFRCKLCSNTYGRFEDASQHAKAAHGAALCQASPYVRGAGVEGPFRCPECDRTFPTAKGRDKHHLVIHLKNSPVVCPDCGRGFNGFRPLERHLRSTHDRNPAHPCDSCEDEFVLGAALEHHGAIAHPSKPPSRELNARRKLFRCPLCGRRCVGAKAFRAHHTKVHGGRAFECGQCQFKTYSPRGLRRHLASVHKAIDLPLYVCSECKAGYQEPIDLEDHYAVSHRRKPSFLCPFCGDKFACIEMLRFHKGRHRAFSCDFCPIAFMKQQSLEVHLTTVHKNDLSREAETLFEIKPSASVGAALPTTLPSSHPDPAEENLEAKILEIQVDGSVEVKDTALLGMEDKDKRAPSEALEPPRIHHLHNTREGVLRELDTRNPLKGFRLKDLPKKINCPVCGKLLTTKFLRTHMRSHQGSLPHKCSRCPKAYAQGTLLRKHMKNRHYEDFLKMGNKMPKRKKIQCEYCDLVFEDIYLLEEHLWQHMQEKSYSCDTCRIKFGMKVNWMEHYKTHYFKEEKPCPICSRSFKSVGFYREHVERCQSNWTCEDCCLKCDNPEMYRRHRKMEHTQDAVMHQCPHCDKTFYNKYGYNDHLITHSSEKQFACRFCDKEFKRQRPLNDHVARVHPGENHGARADSGENHVARADSDENHVVRVHSGENHVAKVHSGTNHLARTNSNLLDHEFRTTVTSSNHMVETNSTPGSGVVEANLSHTDNLPRSNSHEDHGQACGQCGFSFADAAELRRHAAGHRRLPMTCGECGVVYLSRPTLDNHIAVHHSPLLSTDPFVCPHCAEVFANQIDLKTHLPIHSPETPFVCQVSWCHKLFRKDALLRSHMARRHSRLEYFCHRCDCKFLLESDLRKHFLEPCSPRPAKAEEKPFECVLCGFQSTHSVGVMTHVRTAHGGEGTDDPLEQVTVSKWRCSLCAKLFQSRALLTHHLEQHALHGAPAARDPPFRVILSQPELETPATAASRSLTWTDLLPLAKVEVIAHQTEKETRPPIRLASHTWQCPLCFLMTSEEEGIKRHMAASPQCLEALVALFTTRTGVGTSPDIHYIILDSPAPGESPKGAEPSSLPFLLIDNQLQLVMNGTSGPSFTDFFQEGVQAESSPSLSLLEVPSQKDLAVPGGSLRLEDGEREADLLSGSGAGVLLQMEDGQLVIPEMGAGYQLVREETDPQGTTELTYEILHPSLGD